jgi:hypothetical protein
MDMMSRIARSIFVANRPLKIRGLIYPMVMPMITITIISSSSVNPLLELLFLGVVFPVPDIRIIPLSPCLTVGTI